MSNSVVTLIPAGPDFGCSIDSRTIDYYFQVDVTDVSSPPNTDYHAGGLAMSLVGYVQTPGMPIFAQIESLSAPNSGYHYKFNPGTENTQASPKLQIFGANGVEVSSTVPSGVFTDTIVMRLTFLRG